MNKYLKTLMKGLLKMKDGVLYIERNETIP